jgi:hypothetical protein
MTLVSFQAAKIYKIKMPVLFPTKDKVRKAVNTTGEIRIHYHHHEVVVWRPSSFVAAHGGLKNQNTLVVRRLANEGYLR